MYHPRKHKPTFIVDRDALYEYFKKANIEPIEIQKNPEKPWLNIYIYKNSRKISATLTKYIEQDCYRARKNNGKV